MNGQRALLGIAIGIGISIPTAINAIPDPTVKVMVQIVAVLGILWAALRIDPKAISDSIRPPKP